MGWEEGTGNAGHTEQRGKKRTTEQSEVVGDMDDGNPPETKEAGQDRTYRGPRNGRDRRAEKEANHDGDREEGAGKKKASSLASLLILTVALVCQGP